MSVFLVNKWTPPPEPPREKRTPDPGLTNAGKPPEVLAQRLKKWLAYWQDKGQESPALDEAHPEYKVCFAVELEERRKADAEYQKYIAAVQEREARIKELNELTGRR